MAVNIKIVEWQRDGKDVMKIWEDVITLGSVGPGENAGLVAAKIYAMAHGIPSGLWMDEDGRTHGWTPIILRAEQVSP